MQPDRQHRVGDGPGDAAVVGGPIRGGGDDPGHVLGLLEAAAEVLAGLLVGGEVDLQLPLQARPVLVGVAPEPVPDLRRQDEEGHVPAVHSVAADRVVPEILGERCPDLAQLL